MSGPLKIKLKLPARESNVKQVFAPSSDGEGDSPQSHQYDDGTPERSSLPPHIHTDLTPTGSSRSSPAPQSSVGGAGGSAKATSKSKGKAKAGSVSRESQPLSPVTAVRGPLSKEEFDSLPAAKRRKTAKARGAPGPGRGWRKGLKTGDKPVYDLPPEEETPAVFAPVAKKRGAKQNIPPAAPTHDMIDRYVQTGEVSALPQTVVLGNAGHKPTRRNIANVMPTSKIPIGFPVPAPLDRTLDRKTRNWTPIQREVASISGHVWGAHTWLGGKDKGYDHAKIRREEEVVKALNAAGLTRDLESKVADGTPGL